MTPRAMACFLCWMHARAPRDREALLQALPAHVREALRQQAIPRGPPEQIVEPLTERLDSLHSSWLPPPQASKPTAFSWKGFLQGLPEFVLAFWQKWLWQQIVSQQWIPKALLPDMGEWEPLLRLSKHELTALIDDLSVFDIVVNLRRSVLPEEQKLWSTILSERQKKIAQKLLQQPIWPGQAPLPLRHAQPEEVARQLHVRGCLRLGAALHGLHEGFIWYIVHRLDRGRGDLVQRAALSETAPDAIASARRSLQWALHALSQGTSR